MLAVVTMPVAIVATRYSDSYDLLHAAFAIPVAIGLGIGAIARARAERRRTALTIDGGRGPSGARWGAALGVAGIAIASAALVSLIVYEILTYLGEH